jgi:hypothetical protein
MITFGELEGTGEDAVMAYLKVLPQHSPGENEEDCIKSQSVSWPNKTEMLLSPFHCHVICPKTSGVDIQYHV